MKGQEYPTSADWVGEVLEGIIALFAKRQLLNWQETSKRRIFWEKSSLLNRNGQSIKSAETLETRAGPSRGRAGQLSFWTGISQQVWGFENLLSWRTTNSRKLRLDLGLSIRKIEKKNLKQGGNLVNVSFNCRGLLNLFSSVKVRPQKTPPQSVRFLGLRAHAKGVNNPPLRNAYLNASTLLIKKMFVVKFLF